MPPLSLDGLRRNIFHTSRQLTYTYYTFKPARSTDKPTLLFCHGFPDDASEFGPIVPRFTSLDFPIIIPDMLGYNGSSKPTDPAVFNSKAVATDLAEIIHAEGASRVVPIGHDWGAFIAARFYNWNPQLCAGLILMNVAYIPPNREEPFDLKKNNEMTTELLGYPNFAYWEFFTADDASSIIENHMDSFWTVLHTTRPMREIWCSYGAMREYLLEDKRSPLRDYALDQDFKDQFVTRMKRDSFKSPLNWYVSLKENHHHVVEKHLAEENIVVNVPHLFLACTQDEVCRPEFVQGPKDAGLLPDLTIKTIDEPHWCVFSNPSAVADALAGWLLEKFP